MLPIAERYNTKRKTSHLFVTTWLNRIIKSRLKDSVTGIYLRSNMRCHLFPQTSVIVLFLFLLMLRVEGKEMIKVKAQTLTGEIISSFDGA